jgi:hypothetical protein
MTSASEVIWTLTKKSNWNSNRNFYCKMQGSPYQAVTGKIYRLQHQCLPPMSGLEFVYIFVKNDKIHSAKIV